MQPNIHQSPPPPRDFSNLTTKQLKRFTKYCLAKFNFYGTQSHDQICRITESNDTVNFPIGHAILKINDMSVATFTNAKLNHLLSTIPFGSTFTVCTACTYTVCLNFRFISFIYYSCMMIKLSK
jgi:hypothetical protein